jgi:hypothetical protein
MRRVGLLLIGMLGTLPLAAQEIGADAVLAVADVERTMLDDTRIRYEALSRRQADLVGEIDLLRAALSAAVHELEAPDHRRVSQLAGQLERAESERSGLLLSERLLVDRITQHLQRLELFEDQLDSLEAQRDAIVGALTGTWDIVLMPGGQRGSAALQQTGALVTGTYELDGDWTGSLQGTLVNRKVFLLRIDSKLGKSMEFEGYLSSDGERIRGSWLNYELAGATGSTGQWSAERRAEPR